MENNFKCPDCGEEIFIPNYQIFCPGGVPVYKDKSTGEEITCKCSKKMIPIDKPGEYNVLFGKFESMDGQRKSDYFQKLSSEENKKNRQDYVREAKARETRNNNPIL